MTDREKLIGILKTCEELVVFWGCSYEEAADCLIANGLTFVTDTNVDGKWNSVKDRLPEPGVVVLVHSKLGCTYFSHRLYNHVEGKPFCIEYSGGWEVTHWMPLPEPPKEG